MNYLITGASRGIGYDTALALAKNPAHTILAISRNTERLQALADEAQERYQRQAIHILGYDLAQGEPDRLRKWLQSFGPLHGIINNAGLLINKGFLDLSREDWAQTFAINLFGVVDLLQVGVPLMTEGGHVINIGSMGGFQGSSKFPGLSAYSASKAALANLTECLAEELKEQHIKLNCLALGAVQTEMLATAFPGFAAPVTSDQMGNLVAWFLENGHTFFNGKVLPVSVSTP
jgi:NAD(P)-dependent dehydrogenase (short-subunit alcohol dehydrogenase family)